MAVVLGPAIGPVVGGYFAEAYNWRWVFGLVVPLCVVSMLCVYFFIRETGDCQALISERMRFLVSMVGSCAVDSEAGVRGR